RDPARPLHRLRRRLLSGPPDLSTLRQRLLAHRHGARRYNRADHHRASRGRPRGLETTPHRQRAHGRWAADRRWARGAPARGDPRRAVGLGRIADRAALEGGTEVEGMANSKAALTPATLAFVIGAAAPAVAQEVPYPTRSIQLIVPFPPGAS